MLRIASYVGLVVTLALGGCSSGGSNSDAAAGSGGGGTGGTGTGGTGGGAQAFTLTSPAFTLNQPIPAAHTCAGAGTSPAFDWTMGPAGTASYALLMTDLTSVIPVVQWAVWDIPASVRSLAGGLPATVDLTNPTAKQVSIAPTGTGYPAPCPGGATHQYVFRLYALDVATLPNVTTTSTPPQVGTVILDNLLDFTDLVGTTNASAP